MSTSVMDSICEYISGCPYIDSKLPFYLDFVDNKDCYCVAAVPNIPCRKDVVGNRIYTVSFEFAFRKAISNDVERGGNVEFLEKFCRWIEEQNEQRRFPALAPNETGKSIRVTESAMLDEVDENRTTGVYVARLEFIYKQRRI